ncbi:aminodeoxychorismate synthase component I [uncultured Draconibacterium sp.]|uniref:aminodeoxychorismate synthase component I n=1 Tax=uncultured Draconibacterium sp. TaxID=1573823 RepID=UPI0025EF204C|nr:aminodeoxychorismate synthase component I [uncultured Draconibacterium sp.]
MHKKENIRVQMNELGRLNQAFVFIINFEADHALIFSPDDSSQLLWQTRQAGNFETAKTKTTTMQWEIDPVAFSAYQQGFSRVQQHIHNGDTYLLNYTQPTAVKTNLSLEEIFHESQARYKVLLKDRFVCFSPEIFVQIEAGKISSFPMKGTMDATLPNAKEHLLNDSKELAEHHTIVDLIRNDLSLVAENVTVEKFRYLERLKTNRRDLWQVSSKISGQLPQNYTECIGDIVYKLLPAGSICGAPKKKTVEIIKATEGYKRGFYTGVFGYFDGKNLDSCVLIRYIEKQENQLVYKSGGGVTFLSDAKSEYEELVKKVYVPLKDKD